MRENRTYGLKWRGLETWPRWNCEPTLQSKEQDWKPSTYSRRASPRPYRMKISPGRRRCLIGIEKPRRPSPPAHPCIWIRYTAIRQIGSTTPAIEGTVHELREG
jgi:hypothetical protein